MFIVYLVLSLAIIGLVMMIIAFTYPEYYGKAGKFIFRMIRRALKRPDKLSKMASGQKQTGELAIKVSLADQIAQLVPGQVLRFKIPETQEGEFITVQLNPQYSRSGRRYIIGIEDAIAGMPGNRNTLMYVSDEPMEIATSILNRQGEPFFLATELPAGGDKIANNTEDKTSSADKIGTTA